MRIRSRSGRVDARIARRTAVALSLILGTHGYERALVANSGRGTDGDLPTFFLDDSVNSDQLEQAELSLVANF